MKRLNNDRFLFEAPASEQITLTLTAVKVPFAATYSVLESGGQFTQTQAPTLPVPVDIRNFKMPTGSREFFVLSSKFPPAALTDADAKYTITLAGGGTTDGPKDIFPPAAGSTLDLPFEFKLKATAGVEGRPGPAAKKAAAKKKAAKKGGRK